MNWDKEKVFREAIVPLVENLYKECERVGLPMVCAIQYQETEDATKVSHTKVLAGIDVAAGHKIIALALLLDKSSPDFLTKRSIALVIELQHELEKIVKEHKEKLSDRTVNLIV